MKRGDASDDVPVGIEVGHLGDAALVNADAPAASFGDAPVADAAANNGTAETVGPIADSAVGDGTALSNEVLIDSQSGSPTDGRLSDASTAVIDSPIGDSAAALDTASVDSTDPGATGRCDPDLAKDYFYYSANSTPTGLAERFQRTQEGGVILDITYGRGPDQRWLTADDVVTSYVKTETTGTLQMVREFTGSGPDGIWFTDDDVEPAASLVWQCNHLDPQGRIESMTLPTGRGPDGKLCTSDDVVGRVARPSPSLDSFRARFAPNLTKTVYYSAPGPDGLWLTSDDVIQCTRRFQDSADGKSSTQYRADGPGPDGVWGTGDEPEVAERIFTFVGPDETDMRMFLNGGYTMGLNFYCKTPAPF